MDRIEIINTLIENLDYKRYLEIGVKNGQCFSKINCDYKTGVDIKPVYKKGIIAKSSDEFFRDYCGDPFDIIFVDGLHEKHQTIRDIENSLAVLLDYGCIVVHDCLPTTEACQMVPRTQNLWTGDVWKAIHHLRVNNSQVRVTTVDCDWGCAILEKKQSEAFLPRNENVDWNYFSKYKHLFMNIIPPQLFGDFVWNKKSEITEQACRQK